MGWMAHRKWKETKQQPSMLPGPEVPGCCLASFHFLWAILCPQAVHIVGVNISRMDSHNIAHTFRSLLISPLDSPLLGGTTLG